MIGVIVIPGPSLKMHGLDAQRSLAMLPVGDRPMLQHIVESLVANRVTGIELIVGHAPEEVEALLGNGDRWGCKFRYHLQAQLEFPYRSLRVIPGILDSPWLLVHAEEYPSLVLPQGLIDRPILYCGGADGSTGSNHNHPRAWRGTAIFPQGDLALDIANDTREQLHDRLQLLGNTGQARLVTASQWLDASTPAALLSSQALLLSQQLAEFMISGTERETGIWISRNVVIHPTVELKGPLYIGPNSRINRGARIGANTVIGSECIVDTETIIEDSLVTSGSYIGEGLEVNRAIVHQNLLICVPLDTSIDVAEGFLLGSLRPRPAQHWLAPFGEACMALILIILLLPISVVSVFYYARWRRMNYISAQCVQLPTHKSELEKRTYSLPCIGENTWASPMRPSWASFLRQFVPGLTAIARAKLHFVGLPPRTPEQIGRLSAEWQLIYLQNKSGLITEASLNFTEQEETQLYIADAYYAAHRGLLYDFRLAFQYFSQLAVSTFKRAS